MAITMYGIPNCDTVKKARAWLDARGVAYVFHDFKKQGVPADRLTRWTGELGVDTVLNRRGTTWRRLSPEQQAQAQSPAGALALMLAQPSVIKRPLMEWGQAVSAGFDAQAWAERC